MSLTAAERVLPLARGELRAWRQQVGERPVRMAWLLEQVNDGLRLSMPPLDPAEMGDLHLALKRLGVTHNLIAAWPPELEPEEPVTAPTCLPPGVVEYRPEEG